MSEGPQTGKLKDDIRNVFGRQWLDATTPILTRQTGTGWEASLNMRKKTAGIQATGSTELRALQALYDKVIAGGK